MTRSGVSTSVPGVTDGATILVAATFFWAASCQARGVLNNGPGGAAVPPEISRPPAAENIALPSATTDIADGGAAAMVDATDASRDGDRSLSDANGWCLQADGFNGFKGEPVVPGRFWFQIDDGARVEVSSESGRWIPVSEPRAPHTVALYRYDHLVQRVRGVILRSGAVLGFAYGGGIGTYVGAAPASAGCKR